MAARLPQPGGDDNTWGDVLNEFLEVEHNPDGTLKKSFGAVAASSPPSTAITGTLTPGQIALVDATAANATRTLPSATTAGAGAVVNIKKVDSSANTVTIQPDGTDSIVGGGSPRVLRLEGESVELISNGTNQWVARASDVPSSALSATYVRKGDLVVNVDDYADDQFVWGVDDTAPWQAALDAARNSGVFARIYATPGKLYQLRPLKFYSNVAIDLNGATLKALTRVGGTNIWDALLYSAGCPAANGCVGDGTTFVSNVTVRNGTFDTAGRCYSAVKVQNASEVSVESCAFPTINDKIAIRLDNDTSKCVVDSCRIVMSFDSPFGTIANAQGVSCFSSTVDSTAGGYGNYGSGTVNSSIFTDPTHLSRQHHVVNNFIENGTHGVSLWGADGCVIEGNTIVNPSHRGVIASPVSYRNVITANVVYGTFSCAYLLAFGSRWNVVSDNIAYCTSSQSELNAFRASYGASDNLFSGNYAYGVAGAAYRCFTGAVNNTFVGNKADSCQIGLEFRSLITDNGYQQNVNTPAMTGNVAQGNDFTRCNTGIQLRQGTTSGAGTTPATTAGIAIALNNCAVIGNKVSNSTTNGVLVIEDTAGGVTALNAFANVVIASGATDWQTPRSSGHFSQFIANAGAGMQSVHRLPATGNADEWRDSGDALRAYVSATGAIVTSGRRAAGSTVVSTVGIDYVNTTTATQIGLRVDGQSAQTADLQQWTVGAGPNAAVIAPTRIDKSAFFVTAKHAAPADADLNAGDMAFWFDQTNGAAKLMIKAKQADGTVRIGQLNLT